MKPSTKKFIIKSVCEIAVILAVVLSCARNINDKGNDKLLLQPKFDSQGYWRMPDLLIKKNSDNTYSQFGASSLYGTYLAARTAHIRQDFATAVEYYKLAHEKDPENSHINQTIYAILLLIGNVDEAAPYAERELQTHPHEPVALFISAVKNFADGNYDATRESVQKLNNEAYKKFISPFFMAWSYAAENKTEEAINALKANDENPSLTPLTLFHKALIYDVTGNKEKAAENFSQLVSQYPKEITFRILEITTDFYARYGDKETARRILNRYNDDTLLATLLKDFDKNIENKTSTSPAIINTPQKGLAEAIFNIGTIFRLNSEYLQFAHNYISAASYLNPEYDISKIALANVLEEQGLFKEANRYYEQIDKSSGSYFIAQMKLIENYNTLKEYTKAEKVLQKLLKDYPDNTQLLGDLGNLANILNKDEEAIRIYHKAIDSMGNDKALYWPTYYSLAAVYDKLNRKDKAEEYLLQALILSKRDANVLNYLGYFWLMQDKNVDDAAQMIVDAYLQLPFEGHIIDSLGWVFYRIGNYSKAIELFEKASDLQPGNAVISDHLGDAYWMGGRRNEAVFQWEHALVLKEDSDLI
ncbi:MAG: tetratricopeptide repeat protein, partial [Alphaproteobacteria bacterium]|nr:tetratricopeptide repeat protein [Alphaproteobacteria bacterium]